jgi:hypothetical protein
MKLLKYISLLVAGGLIYFIYNTQTAANYVNQFRQEKITPSTTLNSVIYESYPIIYDIVITLIPSLEY